MCSLKTFDLFKQSKVVEGLKRTERFNLVFFTSLLFLGRYLINMIDKNMKMTKFGENA